MSAAIGNLVVASLTTLGSLAAGIMSLKATKAHGNPVRSGLRWVPIALTSLFIGSVLDVATYALAVDRYLNADDWLGNLGFLYFGGGETANYISQVSAFFSIGASMALFMALLNVGTSILVMLDCKSKHDNRMRWTAWIFTAVIMAITLAITIGYPITSVVTSHLKPSQRGRAREVYRWLGVASSSLTVIAYTWALAFCIIVSKRVKAARRSGNPYPCEQILRRYQGAVAVSWFGVIFWIVTLAVTESVANVDTYYDGLDAIINASIVSFIYYIMYMITPLISLILLIVLGKRQDGGLWTVDQDKFTNTKIQSHGV